MDSIDGILKRVLFHKPSKWSPAGIPYLIAALHNDIIVKGELRKPLLGERYRFYGEYRRDKKYPDRESFEFSSHEVLIDQSADGVSQYLSAHVSGVGKARAALIVEHFGADTLHVLRTNPERIVEAPGIKAELATKLIEAIRSHFDDECRVDPVAYARLVELFSDYYLPKKVLAKLLEDWGSDAPGKVTENPYMLLAYPRMSWENVDSFATARAGYDAAGVERHKAAILEALERIAADGHTVASRVDVEEAAFRLIGQRPAAEAWVALIDHVKVVEVSSKVSGDDEDGHPGGMDRGTSDLVALPKLDAAEREIADRLVELADAAKPLDLDPTAIPGLNPDQVEAVRVLVDNGVAILAGAPGTGKSWTLARLIRAILDSGGFGAIKLTAPTGKASKRSAELLSAADALGDRAKLVPCTTIHRALGPTPSDQEEGVPAEGARVGRGRDEFGFSKNAENPIEVDFLVVEEASMLDVGLACSLLSAIPLGTRIVFVGDPHQLPSVGPGSVLRDMIAASIPTATLTKIVRSDGGGRVVRACHAIKDGRMPEPAGKPDLPTENWIHIEASEPAQIAAEIVALHAKIQSGNKQGWDAVLDMQVVAAQRGRYAFSCDNLNALLSEQLNPSKVGGPGEITPSLLGGVTEESDDSPKLPFRIGDKVVRKKNGLADEMTEFDPGGSGEATVGGPDRPDWTWGDKSWTFKESPIVNGDMGIILDIVPHPRGTWVVVKFWTPERVMRLSLADSHLHQAYAITCHSAQGSGFTYTIVPVHPAFYWDSKKGVGLWCRELVYTAISRAEKLLVTVGQIEAVRLAIGRKTIDQRQTKLADRIKRASLVPAGRIEGEEERWSL